MKNVVLKAWLELWKEEKKKLDEIQGSYYRLENSKLMVQGVIDYFKSAEYEREDKESFTKKFEDEMAVVTRRAENFAKDLVRYQIEITAREAKVKVIEKHLGEETVKQMHTCEKDTIVADAVQFMGGH